MDFCVKEPVHNLSNKRFTTTCILTIHCFDQIIVAACSQMTIIFVQAERMSKMTSTVNVKAINQIIL